MKFKLLNEEYTSDDLYQELIDYIYNELEYAVDNLAMKAASDIDDYDADYCSEDPNMSSQNAYNKLRQAAEYFAEFLLKNAPEVIHESLNENIEISQFIGKPLKDFLKTIDHRTKVSLESENGYDNYGGVGEIGGMSGLAHDASWYLADKIVKDIQEPSGNEKRFYEYKILIECDNQENKTDEPLEEEFKEGQEVWYMGEKTFIKEIDNDPKYGIDLLIKNPHWDGKDPRFEYIWVADKVELEGPSEEVK